jgi:hypothetical protein
MRVGRYALAKHFDIFPWAHRAELARDGNLHRQHRPGPRHRREIDAMREAECLLSVRLAGEICWDEMNETPDRLRTRA